MTNFLRPLPLKAGSFQICIADRVAAIIRRTSPVAFAIYILTDQVTLLAEDVLGSPTDIAERLASGEFDNDFRFEIYEHDEPELGCTHTVIQYSTPSQIQLERFTTDDPYGYVGREREAQSERAEYTLEERFDLYAERGW